MNKLFALVATLSLSVTIAACESLPNTGTVGQVVTQPADKIFNTLADEKAYWGVLQFEVQANSLAGTAVDMGLLKAGSPAAIKVADLLLRLKEVTDAAKAAKNANDATTLMEKVAAGKALSNEILELLS